MLGKKEAKSFSPIIDAIATAETGTTGEIRVHLSKAWLERDVFGRAVRLFRRFNMYRTAQRNAVLIYVNLRKRKFAIVGDSGFNQAVGQRFWEELAINLRLDLHSTHPERAIAIAVLAVGNQLRKHFPTEPAGT